MNGLIEELKRRNVLRTAALYGAGGWLLVQVATQVFPFFDIPNWAVRLVVVAVLVGFPFALVISWFYELTPSGFKPEPGEDVPGGVWRKPAFRLALLSAAAIGLTVLIAALVVPHRSDVPAPAGMSIAVLPFRNLSASADNAYFAAGMQDEILTRLTRIGALRVIARTSTARYASPPDDLPKIARELGVDNILEGSVQRHEDEVRINVQLVRAASNSNLWSETYDRKVTDLFGVESEVARAIAASLKAALSGAERRDLDSAPTTDARAYDQYLRAKAVQHSFDSVNLVNAARFLREAVRLDPNFAEAWAQLAQLDAQLGNQLADVPDRCAKAGEEAATALRLKPDLGDAFRAQGYFLYSCKGDLDAAQAAFEQARLRLPGSTPVLEALANVQRHRGAVEQAAGTLLRALDSDPRNAELLSNYALTLVELRRFDEVHPIADRALDVVPDDTAALAIQVYTYQAQGQLPQAQRLLEPLAANPQDASMFDYQALQLLYQRRTAEAVTLLRGALAQDLGHAGIAAADYWYLLGVAQRAAGDAVAARQAFAGGHALIMRYSAMALSPDIAIYRDAMLCLTAAGQGDEPAAARDCAAVAAAASASSLYAASAREAMLRANVLRGRSDAAIAALPESLQAHYYSYLYSAPLTPALLRQDPIWDSLRADPRFAALARDAAP